MDTPYNDDESSTEIAREGWILLRIHVPEFDTYKCLQFPIEQLVWDIKNQVIASLPKELKEAFNYGLFSPPSNGKAGKFLDEERRLGDYPFSGPVGFLELKYKRRVYKMLNLDERQLRALHSRSNLRRFLECIHGGHVDKVSKMCAKGLDPNFHCNETGETPLTIAACAKKPQKLLIALVNGGALLDYRTKDGSTALHRAVEKDSLEAVTTLLELGASPNYKDMKMLTPVYISVAKKIDPKITEVLLHDHATLGTKDSQGWNEVHQACRNNLVQHLEHLLAYGADMDSKNSTGNTPLHVCAVNNQETCARILLFRGANREALNYANQTPYQVAVIASNFELADMIQNFRNEHVVPIRESPRYNPRRRSGIQFLHTESTLTSSMSMYNTSNITWNNQTYHAFARNFSHQPPPSPCLSDQPFNSTSSSLSESSSSHRSQEDDISFVTDKSLGDTSDTSSSGVGTNSESAMCSIGHPNTTVVCIEKYEAKTFGHLSIQPGDVIEVVGSTDCGLLEGFVRGTSNTGLFPSQYIQEVQFRHKNGNGNITTTLDRQNNNHTKTIDTNNFVDSQHDEILKKPMSVTEPRTVILQRSKRGFGFVLRGAKAASPLMQLKPSSRCPALQYLDDVDPGGVADLAGLRKGDFLLSINGEDVSCASHEYVVELIRNSSEVVTLTVVTVLDRNNDVMNHSNSNIRQFSTLPRRLSTGANAKAPAPPRRDPKTTLSVGRARARSMVAGLEGNGNDDDIHENISLKASSIESINKQNQSVMSTPVQTYDSSTMRTASIKSRPTSIGRITAAELEDLFQRQQGAGDNKFLSMMSSSRFQSSYEKTTPQASPSKGPLVYASIAEMKRKNKKNGTYARPVAIPTVTSDLKRSFHSSPDLPNALNGSSTWTSGMLVKKGHLSQEDVQNIHMSIQRLNLPPPDCAPPAPPINNNATINPIGDIVKVDVCRKSEYDSTVAIQKKIQQQKTNQEIYVSSFKPTINAKMYASPQDLKINVNPATAPSILPSYNEQNITKINLTGTQGNLNPYAQPGKIGVEPTIVIDQNMPAPPAPPIPEPDYSSSEEDEKEMELDDSSVNAIANIPYDDECTNTIRKNVQRPKEEQQQHQLMVAETSGSSVSSNNSNAVQHSFTVDEIKKIRTNLKSSSKSIAATSLEGDNNSSSGVSSDQEVKNSTPVIVPKEIEPKKVIISTEDAPSDEDSPPLAEFQRNNSLTRKQASIIAANRAKAISNRQMAHGIVSLTQLPPPIEAYSDDEDENDKEIFAPPPPEFSDIVSNTRSLHINSHDYHQPNHHHVQQKSVRIVGALPKQVNYVPSTEKVRSGSHQHHHIHHFHHGHHQHH
ncbi:hypothetical protein PVAND_003718 [Polypedilum vanderplanki]|uniref:Uncharacterized protein n=1 Tax=Polypedilum vanderplanki TaxID=319348 RepID=A0A9J6BUX1_POLVA|nr:hypothetical protein PVAND_003718 [Polypedilum vanderplanki]